MKKTLTPKPDNATRPARQVQTIGISSDRGVELLYGAGDEEVGDRD